MSKLREIIKSTGLKNEYIIKRTNIPRNKFYMALKAPSLLSMDELDRLSFALQIEKKILIKLIND
jgi:predicted transcriptional regulator